MLSEFRHYSEGYYCMPERRFPPPWFVEDIGAAFVVIDSAGQKLAYVYFEDEPGWRILQLEQVPCLPR